MRPEDVAGRSIPRGPDLDAIVEAVTGLLEAGFDRHRAGAAPRRRPRPVPQGNGRRRLEDTGRLEPGRREEELLVIRADKP